MTTLALRAWLVRLEVAARQRVYRGLVSRLLVPFWPRIDLSGSSVETLADEAVPIPPAVLAAAPEALREPVSRLAETPDRLACRRISGRTIDVEPRSGALFFDGKWATEGPVRELLPVRRTHPDLTRFLRLRPMLREPVVVLHGGGDTSLDAFFTDLLPRFFSLDALDLPRDLLVIVPVSMAMTDPFQDAINDGVFRPRPIELMQPRRVTRTETVYRVDRPLLRRDVYERLWQRISDVYSLDGSSAVRPVFLCEGGAERAARLFATWPQIADWLAHCDIEMIDPAALSLGKLVRRLWGAPLVMGPDTGEVSACVLGGPGLGRVIELSTGRRDPKRYLLASTLGCDYALLPPSPVDWPEDLIPAA
ncbi:hypothetical protein [Stappia sp.]|uniref:hypothetical protein n=1 Tax=Stappia sp. TaxID=1870903 RepID=UPI003C7ECAE4